LIERLEITNFLAFKHLKVENLKRVNLITGRNNTGKTAFLEAIRAFKSSFDSEVLTEILENRGFYANNSRIFNNLYNKSNYPERTELIINNYCIESSKNSLPKSYQISSIFKSDLSHSIYTKYPDRELVYISFGFDETRIEQQWSNIALTPTEDDVFEIIKSCIQDDFIRLSVTSKGVIIRLKNEEKPLNIKVLGDGMKRIVSIAMALASSKNKLLLIDEIEIGLHHTVLAKLWEIIFKYAQEWNIQVFATTHSNDAIHTFRNEAAKSEAYQDMTNIIRLQRNRKDQEIEAIAYEYDMLDTILEAKMDIR